MKYHVVSDIHLEFYKKYPGIDTFIKKNDDVDYLFLCGDIGDPFSNNYKLFLEDCNKFSYKYIFIIAGNHEYYHHHTRNVTHKIRSLSKSISNKIIFLHNSSFELDDYLIIGTTLWTNINIPHIQQYLSDYKYIREWSIERNNNENKKAITFIEKELTRNKNKKVIIMTHHCPLLYNEYSDLPTSCAFYNDLKYIFERKENNIVVWLYGHDHMNDNIVVKDVNLISNQYGYPDDKTSNYNYNYYEIYKNKNSDDLDV